MTHNAESAPREPLEIDRDRPCERCGEMIPARWRHFQPMCRCVWEHHLTKTAPPRPLWSPRPGVEQASYYCAPDPDCPICDGYGQVPCIPQDLSTFRVSGVCRVCGAAAFYLTHDDGEKYQPVPGSARHRYVVLEDDDHEAQVTGGPIGPMIEDALIDAGHYNEGSGS